MTENIKFKDALRAQYYLKILLACEDTLNRCFEKNCSLWPKMDIRKVADKILVNLADKIDQMLLPVIAYEIATAKNDKLLVGKSPQERYKNFFVQDGSWAARAICIVDKYPYLFQYIDLFAETYIGNILECVGRFECDIARIKKLIFAGRELGDIVDICLQSSDRHFGGKQVISFEFESGDIVFYKPVNLEGYKLFARFVKNLDMPFPYDMRLLEAIAGNGYGWIKHVEHMSCNSIEEIKNYYRRAGCLLAIADTLNYCDGHFENLIANGSYPVIVDLETLFHSFGEVDPEMEERSVLFTGLIQKPPAKDEGYVSAFQSPSVQRFDFLNPYAINDRTDDLEVRFQGISPEIIYNCPRLNEEAIGPNEFIDEFIDGFRFAYRQIKCNADKVISDKLWWEKFKRVKCRQLVRHTMYYVLLIRKMQQPEYCIDGANPALALRELLEWKFYSGSLNVLVDYEIEDLLKVDVPYFYHYPSDMDLYDATGKCYKDYFTGKTVIDEIRTKLSELPDSYMNRSADIIRNVMPVTL